MSSKPKALLKHPKHKKKAQSTLDDADDYLAAANDDEDSLGKHRAGAPQKAIRFGGKALELYSQGLAKYPRNFDLAYNKARLELEIATHPLLTRVLDVPALDLLKRSLASHEFALSLEPDNADTLFNIAQVLTSLAELIAKDDNSSDADALQCLEQALQYQARCLQIQEVKYAESRRTQEEAAKRALEDDDDEGGAQLSTSTTTAYEDREEDEQWVSVVEPVTASSLLDTILAQLSTLTTLCSILNSSLASAHGSQPQVPLTGLESTSRKLMEGTLPRLINSNLEELEARSEEISFTKVTLTAALLELAFRTNSLDTETYRNKLEETFSLPDLLQSPSPRNILLLPRSLISFNNALADTLEAQPLSDPQTDAKLRWTTLSKVQTLLTSAASHPEIKSDTAALASTHLLRGDVSLLLHALSYPPVSYQQAISNSSQLLKNAEVFYRNSMKLYASTGQDGQEEKEIAEFRGTLVGLLQSTTDTGNSSSSIGVVQQIDQTKAAAALKAASAGKTDAWRQEQLQDMIDEGLVHSEIFGLQR